MKEVEIKATYENRNKIIEKLKELGFEFKEKYLLEDYYYSQTGTEMANSKDFIRIRSKGNEKELTFKGKKEKKGNIWERVELNTPVEEPEKFVRIFEELGFNKISENKSNREYWQKENIEFVFVDMIHPTEIHFLEIEADEDKIKWLMSELGNLVDEAGEEIFEKLDEARRNKVKPNDK